MSAVAPAVTWGYAGVSRSWEECRGVAMVMTQQYLVGELSVILGEIQAAAATEACARQAWDLRLEVESAPVTALPSVAARAGLDQQPVLGIAGTGRHCCVRVPGGDLCRVA
jgi:hypothetical protein